MALVQGGTALAILVVIGVVTHWSSLNHLPRDAVGIFPYVAALLAGAALLGAMVAANRRRERQRQAEIAAWAQSGIVTMDSGNGGVPDWAGRLNDIHPRQRNGRLDLLLTASRGDRRSTVADYYYEVHPEQEYLASTFQ
jgi:hypothetical protein